MARIGAIIAVLVAVGLFVWSIVKKSESQSKREEILEKAREAKAAKAIEKSVNQSSEDSTV